MKQTEPAVDVDAPPGERVSRPLLSFMYAVPIGSLGGLIGLGGAEFRLPVLAGPLGYRARQAVPLNLAVSFVTLAASLAIRSRTLSLEPVQPLLPAVLGMVAGAVVASVIGVQIAGRVSNERLHQLIFLLLLAIGGALIVEGFLPREASELLPDTPALMIVVGVVLGLSIGLVSSLLGVAGGELIIPSLVFVFGASIKVAGTASLLVSLPTVAVGLLRYAAAGAFEDRRPLVETVAPMGVGSVIGAVIGGLLAGSLPVGVLKVGLGVLLIVSAARTFRTSRREHR